MFVLSKMLPSISNFKKYSSIWYEKKLFNQEQKTIKNFSFEWKKWDELPASIEKKMLKNRF